MKRILILLVSLLCLLGLTACDPTKYGSDAKPVIYLYPTEETEVHVALDYAGELTVTYPDYGEDGWHITASPNGTLTDDNGKTYAYLFWEGISQTDYDFSDAYCVAGKDTAAFLEEALAALGLTPREANEFIVYWLPQMQNSPYNLIAFQTSAYTDAAKLNITPTPDTVIRVFMAYKPLENAVPANDIRDLPSAPERVGFTVVEWGGCAVSN